MRDALVATAKTLPSQLRTSLTWDQGCEMSRHRQIALATDMPVYACGPASPWQRGSNELGWETPAERLAALFH